MPRAKRAREPLASRAPLGGGGAALITSIAARVEAGDAAAAARALSVVINESDGFAELSRAFFRHAGRAHKIGISGPPGGGKSTLVNRVVATLRRSGLKVGVLAVDPTSPYTGGAFLGDRLRVQDHALDPGVFFRSLASRGMVGGVSATIFSAIHVLEAWGAERVLIETVGTGQDEVEISRVADTVVYVTTPSLGDEIQAMKAGAMEAAEVFAVNKSDLPGADKAAAALKTALELGRPRPGGVEGGARPSPGRSGDAFGRGDWTPRVLTVSALTDAGIPGLVAAFDEHRSHLASGPEGKSRARMQVKEELSLYISRRVYRDVLARVTDEHLESLLEKKSDPVTLGERLAARQ